MKFECLSASYDVGIAKKYGINCAILLNKLIYLSRYTSREDGFCWKTSKELEDELGLTRNMQDKAVKKLEEEGIIKTKNTYIEGTQIKCKHFKLIADFEIVENNISDLLKSSKSDLLESNKSIIINKHNNIKEKYNKKKSYGEFNNVLLTDEEYNKLEQANLINYIDTLSMYIESTGKKYKSHYATILTWNRKEKQKDNKEYKDEVKLTQIGTNSFKIGG